MYLFLFTHLDFIEGFFTQSARSELAKFFKLNLQKLLGSLHNLCFYYAGNPYLSSDFISIRFTAHSTAQFPEEEKLQ